MAKLSGVREEEGISVEERRGMGGRKREIYEGMGWVGGKKRGRSEKGWRDTLGPGGRGARSWRKAWGWVGRRGGGRWEEGGGKRGRRQKKGQVREGREERTHGRGEGAGYIVESHGREYGWGKGARREGRETGDTRG